MTLCPINGVGRQATKGADSADSQAKQKALKILGDKVTKKFKSLNGLAEEIKLAATEVLKSSGKSPSRKPAREAVKTFLDDEEQDYKIDDCVRWHLLLQAVRIDQSPDPDTVMAMKALGELIVEARPYLAFENPYEPNKPERFFDKQCSLRAQHSLVKDKSVIFNISASCGTAAAISTPPRPQASFSAASPSPSRSSVTLAPFGQPQRLPRDPARRSKRFSKWVAWRPPKWRAAASTAPWTRVWPPSLANSSTTATPLEGALITSLPPIKTSSWP